MVDKPTDHDDEEEDDDTGTGDASGGGGAAGIVPSYYDLIGVDVDDAALAALVEQALFEQRIAVRSQGYDVTALSKRQRMRNRAEGPEAGGPGGSSLDVEAHPELPEMGGDVDPNTIVLPESEADSRAGNDLELQLKLRQKLGAKLGMGNGLSMEALREALEKKLKQRYAPAAEPEAPAPRFNPKYRPPGY